MELVLHQRGNNKAKRIMIPRAINIPMIKEKPLFGASSLLSECFSLINLFFLAKLT
jgi:hypothetical protein